LKSSAEAKPADSGFDVLLLVDGVFLVEPIELLVLCSRDRCGLAHADSLTKTGLERSWLAATAHTEDGNATPSQRRLCSFGKVSLCKSLDLKSRRSRGFVGKLSIARDSF